MSEKVCNCKGKVDIGLLSQITEYCNELCDDECGTFLDLKDPHCQGCSVAGIRVVIFNAENAKADDDYLS